MPPIPSPPRFIGADTMPPKKKTQPGLRITAKRDGFRRAGRPWPATPCEVAVADLDEQQVAALKREPMLVVEEVELAGADTDGA